MAEELREEEAESRATSADPERRIVSRFLDTIAGGFVALSIALAFEGEYGRAALAFAGGFGVFLCGAYWDRIKPLIGPKLSRSADKVASNAVSWLIVLLVVFCYLAAPSFIKAIKLALSTQVPPTQQALATASFGNGACIPGVPLPPASAFKTDNTIPESITTKFMVVIGESRSSFINQVVGIRAKDGKSASCANEISDLLFHAGVKRKNYDFPLGNLVGVGPPEGPMPPGITIRAPNGNTAANALASALKAIGVALNPPNIDDYEITIEIGDIEE